MRFPGNHLFLKKSTQRLLGTDCGRPAPFNGKWANAPALQRHQLWLHRVYICYIILLILLLTCDMYKHVGMSWYFSILTFLTSPGFNLPFGVPTAVDPTTVPAERPGRVGPGTGTIATAGAEALRNGLKAPTPGSLQKANASNSFATVPNKKAM